MKRLLEWMKWSKLVLMWLGLGLLAAATLLAGMLLGLAFILVVGYLSCGGPR